MKPLYVLLVVASFFTVSQVKSQLPDAPKDAAFINENTIIKDESGKRIEMKTFMELMSANDWTVDPKMTTDGKVDYIQLRRLTPEEKEKQLSDIMSLMGESKMIGTKVPNFEMKDIDGNIISSNTIKDKVVVLNFWFIACKPCVKEIPELNEVYEQYKNNKDIIFVSVTFDPKEKVIPFIEKHDFKYPTVAGDRNVVDKFANGFPTNIIIDKEGKYLDYIVGGFPNIGKRIESSIEKAL